MTRKSIQEMIDRRIVQHYVDGQTTPVIIKEIETRISNIGSILVKEGINVNNFSKSDIENIDSIGLTTRIKYSILYIRHSLDRISDLNWVDLNKKKFKHLCNSQIFGLIKLKEKLSIDNSLPF
jgi:hypothetical protein